MTRRTTGMVVRRARIRAVGMTAGVLMAVSAAGGGLDVDVSAAGAAVGPAAQAPSSPAPASQASGSQTPTAIELDASTLAARTDAARAIIPLLDDVKRRAESRVQVETGGATAPSPFTGTQTTLFSMSLSKRKPVDPQVIQAMSRLLQWEPGNRSAEYEAALFDRWFQELSARVSSLGTRRGVVACDAGCVARTMTALDETWGKAEAEREETRDEVLIETLASALKKR